MNGLQLCVTIEINLKNIPISRSKIKKIYLKINFKAKLIYSTRGPVNKILALGGEGGP